jgi:hypothetical protein
MNGPTPVPAAPAAAVGRSPRSLPRRGGPRWLRRRFHRYMPAALLLLSIGFLFAATALDFVPGTKGWLETFADEHEVMLGIVLNLSVAAFVASVAYYALWGAKHQRALERYRQKASDAPGELVDWAAGEADLVRRDLCRVLADEIEASPEPALVVVRGRAGTGRASLITQLVRELADRNLIPVPVLTTPEQTFDPVDLAQKKFIHHVDAVLASAGEGDAIWRRARSTRDLVVLLDGVDDEIVGDLASEPRQRFDAGLRSLLDQKIAVVLATSREPLEKGLGDTRVVREDLDQFGWTEAERHLRSALQGAGDVTDDALEALKRLRGPVDGFRISPFYLDLICRLVDARVQLDPLSEHTDRWRKELLDQYLNAARQGRQIPTDDQDGAGMQDPAERGQAAVGLAERAARRVGTGRDGMTCPLADLKPRGSAAGDAVALNLLWQGHRRVGFAGDDLGAYLVADSLTDVAPLIDVVKEIAHRRGRLRREERHALSTLIFWHLLREHKCRPTFDGMLEWLEREQVPRPAVVAAAVRIAAACDLEDSAARLPGIAQRAVGWLPSGDPELARALRGPELVRLVRAVAEWHVPQAHEVLWQLATDRHIEIEWPAAKAIALAATKPYPTLRETIEEELNQAERESARALSDPTVALGNEVASLAWILPSLRDADEHAERQLARVAELCLDREMSSLRGEMSLCQGLKLALVYERAPSSNFAHVCELLFERKPPLRFWHARLVLVQALLAHAARDGAETAAGLESQLRRLRRREPHPLVREGMDMALDGMKALTSTRAKVGDELGGYMWVHEREAVQWVEQGKGRAARLAADTVLVSNMLYRLREVDADRADRLAVSHELPHCIRRSHDRREIVHGCDCPHGLCRIAKDRPAVLAARAPFSENFCREQSRLVGLYGPPAWVARRVLAVHRRKRGLVEFWDNQAGIAQREGSRGARSGD